MNQSFEWFTSGDDKMRDDIIGFLSRPPLPLPTAGQFPVTLRFAPLLKIPHRPHTVDLFDAYHTPSREMRSSRRSDRIRSPESPTRQTVSTPHPPPATRSRPDGELSELTLTYVGILRRSEDFNRRAIAKDELHKRNVYKKWMDEFQAMIPLLIGQFTVLLASEANNRAHTERESDEGLTRILLQAESSFSLARRKEGSRPQCMTLKAGRGSIISEHASERCFVELSWRGGVDLCLAAVVVDINDATIGIATNGEGVRGKGRVLLLRPLNDYDGNCGNGVGGSRSSFQLNLRSCPSNVSKIVFVVCPRGSSDNLGQLKQGWLTLSDLDESGASRPLLTIFVDPLRFYGAVVVGSLRRRDDLWQYVNDASSILGHRRPAVVAQVLLLKSESLWEHLDREVSYCRASIAIQECDTRWLLERSFVLTAESMERDHVLATMSASKRPKKTITIAQRV